MGEDKPILTKFGKIVKVKTLDSFIQYGLKDGADIYQDKKQKLLVLALGSEGWFDYHETRWTSGIKCIMDRFTAKEIKPVVPPQRVEIPPIQPTITGQNKTIQEIHNEDFIEFQRRTERTTGKTDQREVFVSLDSVRIHGDLTNKQLMQDKIDKYYSLKEYFENKIKPKQGGGQ